MRVRFPPSPTGYLHVGGARTALFNWLLARQSGGTFVLRVEDTDRERSSPAHVAAILAAMRWLGLDWDEGPHFQSEGVGRHREAALGLLEVGAAYRDFSDPARLRALAEARGIGHPSVVARELAEAMDPAEVETRAAAGEPSAIRLRVPAGETRWDDLIHGSMVFKNADLDDFVILRADGSPTYNLAVVSDDAAQGITHVVRGDDHLSNTPKQILLYRVLGFPVPRFGHVPMILGPDGKRLSKRHGATSVADYQTGGILPSAMFNYLALLGWNPGDEREIMSRDELVDAFSLDRIQKKSAVFDPEKLEWMNGRYIAGMPASDLRPLVAGRLADRGIGREIWAGQGEAWFDDLLRMLRSRARTVDQLAVRAVPYLGDAPELDSAAVAKHWNKDRDAVRERLLRLRTALARVEWSEATLEVGLRELAAEMGVGAGKLIHPLRVALTGQATSPGIFEVLDILGPERALKRVDRALEHLASGHELLS